MVLCCISFGGCTFARIIDPIDPPADLQPSPRQEGHFISHTPPRVETNFKLGIFRYLRWQGQEDFASFSICLFGYAPPGKKRRCFQAYGGVKVDGTETLILRRLFGDDTLYDYVYTPSEQSAFRLDGVAVEPRWEDMGGS